MRPTMQRHVLYRRPGFTRILEDAVASHPPPMVNGRRVKLRYAHAGGQNPPVVVIHGTQTEALPASYHRYLEKIFRRELALHGTPIRIELLPQVTILTPASEINLPSVRCNVADD